jgi:hypothetical protein
MSTFPLEGVLVQRLISINSLLSLDPYQSFIYLSVRVFQSFPTPLRYVMHHELTTTRAEIDECCVAVIVTTGQVSRVV